jgi:hypothetical protein
VRPPPTLTIRKTMAHAYDSAATASAPNWPTQKVSARL